MATVQGYCAEPIVGTGDRPYVRPSVRSFARSFTRRLVVSDYRLDTTVAHLIVLVAHGAFFSFCPLVCLATRCSTGFVLP